MKRELGIKRSFNFEDLPSIVGLDQHAQQTDDDSFSNPSRKRVKRQRTISTDLSSCSALCYCCEEDAGKAMPMMMPAKFTPSSAAASNDSSTTKAPPSPSVARLISPATSHVAVSPELTPALLSEGVSSLPCFPSLRCRNESYDFPATAALEHFMLKQRCSDPTLDDQDSDFSHSFEDESDEESCHLWPTFDQEDFGSPRQVEDFPGHARRVSMASRKSPSSFSVTNSSCHDHEPSSFLSMTSSCKLQPAKTFSFKRSVPTVNQITEALSQL
eukprot:CAMPEP_0172309486 /NCGR_PEP_ID=MMETSP1058-20130122/9753_1 /TAXON_ID=83371 /ORGANISM="Detonula confervacea, Strain CCMP 353" /LENGTH=271 /DNA_ID=CAMNT_0013022115 /DNA_START=62 /DNA_END=877 /DNA_ORIENTATION=+